MDTQEKIAELRALRDSLKDGVADQISKADALDTAIAVLEGTLVTQATALEEKYKGEIETLKNEKGILEVSKTELQAEITSLTDQVVVLNEQVVDLNSKVVENVIKEDVIIENVITDGIIK